MLLNRFLFFKLRSNNLDASGFRVIAKNTLNADSHHENQPLNFWLTTATGAADVRY